MAAFQRSRAPAMLPVMPTRPRPSPPSSAEWLGVRAALAGYRARKFGLATTAVFIAVLAVAILAPLRSASRTGSVVRAAPESDTAMLLRRVANSRAKLVRAESLVRAPDLGVRRPASAPEALTGLQRHSRDSLLMLAATLDELLDRAAKAPLPASFRALADAAALRGDRRTKALSDSLDALERRRVALGPTSGADRAAAEITDWVNNVGAQVREAAVRRRTRLGADLARFDSAAGQAAPGDSVALRAQRDSARNALQFAESLVAVVRAADSATEQPRRVLASGQRSQIPMPAIISAAYVLVLLGGFGWSLASELRRPTIGTAREAERAAGAPVIAVAKSTAAVRTRGGIDPFRMLYLALTATGTKVRTVVISGDDRAVVATVAARLALAAASDARATLVVDSDAEGSPLGGYYRLYPEPGFADAVAGVHLWRDVTHSVGAGEGLRIDVVAGGAIRRGDEDQEASALARSEFTRVRGEYDLCIVAAPGIGPLKRAAALVPSPLAVLCAELGTTGFSSLQEDAAKANAAGAVVLGLVVWDGPPPRVPPRSEQVVRSSTAEPMSGGALE